MFPLYDHNPTQRKPVVTRALILANCVAFLFTWWMESQGVTWTFAGYGVVPSRFSADPAGESVKVLSSMFLHADLMHLLWNMLFLHIFGDNVEDALGKVPYLAFYLLSGAVGSLAHIWVAPLSTVPMVGASGAIAGVLGGYMVLYPRAPVALFNPIPLLWFFMGPIFVLPAWAVVGWWFFGNVMGGLASLGGAETQTAFFAHLGGFIHGLVMIKFLARSPSDGGKWSGLREPPRIAKRRVFARSGDGPFWRE